MRVSEIIETSATMLDISLSEVLKEKDLWVKCYNYIEQELAMSYFPILEIDKHFNVDDIIYFKNFTRKPYQIKSIQDFHGDKINYIVNPDYIELKKNYNGGTFFVKYYYIPEEKEFSSNSTYGKEYIDILKYGVAVEYCLAKGDFDLGDIYSNKYKEAIKKKSSKRNS